MRIHHLNCGSLCPRGGKLFGGAGGLLSPAPMCCHCLLIEGDDGLILVDSGLGVEDVNEPRRLGFLFNAMVRPRLDVAETALRQVADLGYRPSDVRHIVPDPSRPRPRGRDLRFPRRRGPCFRRRASRGLASVDARRAKPLPRRADRLGQEMGRGRGRGRILVWLFGRARDSRNARRGAAGAAARPFARALRRRRPARGRLAAPLRRRLFPSLRSRAGRSALRRKACASSSRWCSSTAHSGAPIRTGCASSRAPPRARSSSSARTTLPTFSR